MRLLADENTDRSVVARLREAGHEVLAVAEMEPGINDAAVLALANGRDALLVTEDKDFGELVFRQRLVHAGVILVRLAGMPVTTKADIIVRLLDDLGDEVKKAFTVVSENSIRVRRHPA